MLLIVSARERPLPHLDEGDQGATQVATGASALEWVRGVRPDAIVVDAVLPDMSGSELCRLLNEDLRIGHTVPVLILTQRQPTPEQRVAALHAGAWGFVRSDEPDECAAKLEIYVQAKRNLDTALGSAPPGVLSRPEVARRARELGALMARMHGGLACLVVAVDADPVDPAALGAVARSARVSDSVGTLAPNEFAVLAPATDGAGARRLGHRIAAALRDIVGTHGLRVGYEAVANARYAPVDPVELLRRATTAARSGLPEPGYGWLRRYDASPVSPATVSATATRSTPPGVVLDDRSVR